MILAHETIMTEVGARLANISTSNGYSVTVKTPKRAMLTPFKSQDLPGVNYWSTGMSSATQAHGRDIRSIPIIVEAHTKTWEKAKPFDAVAAALAADIVTALNRSTTSPAVTDTVSPKLGGTITQFRFEKYDNIIGEGQAPWVGVLVSFSAQFLAVNHDMSTLK